MPSFAVISEGITDFKVLENILYGYFSDEEEEPTVNHVELSDDATTRGRAPPPGGWTLVLRALREGRPRQALQNHNDYVIVQIDTDTCEDPGYDVPRRAADGGPLTPEQLIEKVRDRLVREMGREFYERHQAQIVFAIAVDATECWLLPLLYDGEPAKKAKITGCLEAADWKLRRLNRPPLSTADRKNPASYEKASRDYARRRKLLVHRGENPSLDVFVTNLEALRAGSTGEVGSGLAPPEEPTGTPES